MRGKTAMVWKLRDWQAGDPERQAGEAVALGLDHVSIKVTDGYRPKWESGDRTNYNLLPAAVAALTARGIRVSAWGWCWGDRLLWDFLGGGYKRNTPEREAEAAVAQCRKHGIKHYQVDAEAQYRGQPAWAERLSRTLNDAGPEIEYSLCSYRWPLTAQPDFPVRIFAPYMDAFGPQVYFVQDNRPNGGAIQLVESMRQHRLVRDIPYFPVAPTYRYSYKNSAGNMIEWRASREQLLSMFARAKADGCIAISIWCLEQATAEQKGALRDFEWTPPQPPPTVPIPEWTVELDSWARTQGYRGPKPEGA